MYEYSICTGKKHEIGSQIPYFACVTDKVDASQAAVYVLLEMSPDVIVPLFNGFVNEGIMPGGLLLFINAGQLMPTLDGGTERGMRAEELDEFGTEFVDFIIEDLLPLAAEAQGVKLSDNPDMHFYTGGSSGGMSTWNALWLRNDYFHRGFLSSPTFSAIRGGEEPMVIARKCETRPMRFYLTVASYEPDYYFGDSYYVALNAKGTFDQCGYDFKFEMFPGEGHCSRREEPELLRRVMTFVWNEWETKPVTAGKNPYRIRCVLAENSRWEIVDRLPEPRCAKAPSGGYYRADGGRILLCRDGREITVADGLSRISALCVSSDCWRLYVSDRDRRFVFAYAINPDATLGAQYKLSPFHLSHDCRQIGATDMCIAANDRIFIATELGVQSIITFGINDIILPLPGDLPAESVRLEGNYLYATSGNLIFRRPLQISAPAEDGKPQAPSCLRYGDDFDYCRPHFAPYIP